MTLDNFLNKLNMQPEHVEFTDTIAVIEANYQFKETAFTNGNQKNAAGENSGSCKLFAFAKLNSFSEAQTLACFGAYYRLDVLKYPEASDHQNIRQFIINGWSAIHFDSVALTIK